MIKCNAYSAKFKTDRTCVNNQHKLAEMKKHPRRKRNGDTGICISTMPSEYFRIKECDGCNIGIRLYKKAKAEGLLPVEHRIKCGRVQKSMMAVVDYHTRECQFWF